MELLKILEKIPPSSLDYQEWLSVGMALKHEGYTADDWDSWSRADSRYHAGECEQKWQSFNGSAEPVTAGTIVQMAKDRGFAPTEFRELDWDSEISYEEGMTTVNTGEGIPIHEPESWDPVTEITAFLELLFESNEYVGYVTETYEHEKDGVIIHSPTRGAYDRTAGQLIEELGKCKGDIGSVLGDANEDAGAWVRINPLDGKGIKDENVTEYRYVLIESDSLPIEQQNALMRDLELPIATLTYTGGKSLHAIVRIDASNRDEYRRRVAFMFDICAKNGLAIDRSCKNPSRLSRLPGFMRAGKKQFLVDTNIGKADFAEWKDYIESINDDLPDPESLSAEWDDLPELAPPLIEGVLRQGHKMLIAGPSKAGKSFALIELCIALAEGVKWLGFNCTQGRVLYVNLELDRASCLHRFKDVYTAMHLEPKNLDKLDIWNLRGRSVPMDKLAPKLIRRANKKNYIAVIIDPIYKVITGDENSADQMAKFCNQFDLICTELGTAVIYCHHHSKGSQGGKRSMDRASGSGVFARDPDALLDLTELEVTDTLRKQQEDKQTCRIAAEWLHRFYGENAFDELVSQDDLVTASRMLEIAGKSLHPNSYRLMMTDIENAKNTLANRTAWRIEGTLREFPKLRPLNLWFDYPVHRADEDGVLHDAKYEGEYDYRKNFEKRKTNGERKKDRKESIETAFSGVEENGECSISELAEYLAVTEKTVRSHLKEHGGFWIEDGRCGLKQ